MNGDNIPELHVRSSILYSIFTYYNNELLLWYDTVSYCWPTDRRTILYIRHGGGPTHISYQYFVLDFWGEEQLRFSFEKYDVDLNDVYDEQDSYYFDGVIVTKEQWDALTEPYLSVTLDSIEWVRLTEDFNRIQ